MAAEVYEDQIELTVGILEAVLPDSGQYLASAYPYPSLKPTGRNDTRIFRTIVLENPYLRATIVPDLGGRILRLLDKRTNIEIFPDGPLVPIQGGLRGVEIPQGIQIRYTPTDRLNSMGTVNYQLVPASEEEDDAGVWIGEVGIDLSFNALISIPPDAAEIKIELRMFNRAIGDTPYNGGLSMSLPNSSAHYSKEPDETAQFGYVLHSNDRALSVWSEEFQYPGTWHEQDRLNIHRLGKDTKFSLGARQLDTWKFTLCPHTGISWPIIACKDAAIGFVDKGISIQSSRPLSSYQLRLVDAQKESFDATVSVFPEIRLDLPFENALFLSQVHFSDEAGKIVLGEKMRNITTREVVDNLGGNRDAMAELDSSARRKVRELKARQVSSPHLLPSFRYETSLKRAIHGRFAKSDPTEAGDAFDQALLYNGEDHLAWWLKANFMRSQQSAESESAELLNAHFLAPLEPLLRAEGFLSQPVSQGREPNQILRPLAETPEQFVDVSCYLLKLNLFMEASRFIDEALRHEDLPMLRYLQAYALLSGSRMDVEAAANVRAAVAKPFGPPYPWRTVELVALRTLAIRFPDDARLKEYLAVAEKFASQMPS
jgi:hypothetical protein